MILMEDHPIALSSSPVEEKIKIPSLPSANRI